MAKNNLNLLALDYAKSVPAELLRNWPVPLALADVYVRLREWKNLEEATAKTNWQRFEFFRHAYLARALRAALEAAQLYRDGGGVHLREAIAKQLGLTRENVILGNGSNEIIEFVGHGFLSRDDEVLASKYAFIAYKLVAHLFDARTIETPTRTFQPDLAELLRAITPKTKIIFI